MDLQEIPVQILLLEEGDILVFRHPEDWTDEQIFIADGIANRALERAGKRNTILFMSKCVDLAVVKKEDKP